MGQMERLSEQAEVFHRVPHTTLRRVGDIKFVDTSAVRIEYVPSYRLLERLAFNKISIVKLPPSVYERFCEKNHRNPLENPSVVHTRFGAVYVVRTFVRSNPSKPGHPRKVTGDTICLIVNFRRAGYSFRQIAKQLGLSVRTVWVWYYRATREKPRPQKDNERLFGKLLVLTNMATQLADGGTPTEPDETLGEIFQIVENSVQQALREVLTKVGFAEDEISTAHSLAVLTLCPFCDETLESISTVAESIEEAQNTLPLLSVLLALMAVEILTTLNYLVEGQQRFELTRVVLRRVVAHATLAFEERLKEYV